MRILRPVPFLALAAALSGCAEIDCQAVQPYHASRLRAPIDAPEGLSQPVHSGTYAIPGTPPGEGYKAGACLVRPPRTVEVPEVEEG